MFLRALSIITLHTSVVQAQLAPDSYVYGDTTTLTGDYTAYEVSLDNIPDSITVTGNGSSVVNGDGYQGFQIIGQSGNLATVDLRVSGVASFQGFEETLDGSATTNEGGSVFRLVYGGNLIFEGYSESNRLSFVNNSVGSDGYTSEGGAIFLTGGATASDIYADFSNNHVTATTTSVTGVYARGGAIYIGSTNGTPSTPRTVAGNIYGNFSQNFAEFGGAIYLGTGGTVGNIGGIVDGAILTTFSENMVESALKAGGTTGGCGGGAIRAYQAVMGDIVANFEGNIAHALTSYSTGGAIALEQVTFVGGEYGDNNQRIQGNISNNISYSEAGIGYGGAFSIKGTSSSSNIYLVDSNVTGNIAGSALAGSSNARGGAIYLESSKALNIIAQNSDVLLSGNYEVTGSSYDESTRTVKGGVRDYNAIYALNSTLSLSALNDHIITINDSIEGASTNELIIDSISDQRYDVRINAAINNWNVNVNLGGLQLGSYVHEDGTETRASLANSTLEVGTRGILSTSADSISDAESISNAGIIEFSGGTLAQGINSSTSQAGEIHVLGETSVADSSAVYAESVYIDSNLNMQSGASIDVTTLLYQGVDSEEINNGEQIIASSGATLALENISLAIDTATSGDVFDLIVSDGLGDITLTPDEYNISFTLAGTLLERGTQYKVQTLPDGGLRILFVIPEPSSVSLSLLSLALLLRRRRAKHGISRKTPLYYNQ